MFVHRLITDTFIDNLNENPCVDHINNNELDNNISNLRWCTYQQNSMNTSVSSNNSSEIKGISSSESK